MANINWDLLTKEILARLDILAEYEAMGFRASSRSPNGKGWIRGRALGREDRSASAEINVGDDKQRGRYKDWTEGDAISLFDAMARFGGRLSWQDARDAMLERTGLRKEDFTSDSPVTTSASPTTVELVEPSRGTSGVADREEPAAEECAVAPATAEEPPVEFHRQLQFQEWNGSIVDNWCRRKRGFTRQSIASAGGRLAKYAGEPGGPQVIAFPAFGSSLAELPPCGWVVYLRNGSEFTILEDDGDVKKLKMKTVWGSRRGWMGETALQQLANADVVWKVEGPTDMLALDSVIPDELRSRHVVITNSGGAGERPLPEMISHLTGKKVFVIHDADVPGQGFHADPERLSGAHRWCREISKYAREVRNVQLPYEIAPKRGKDTRDFFIEGHSFAELLAIAEATPLYTPPQCSPLSSGMESFAGMDFDVFEFATAFTEKDLPAETELPPEFAEPGRETPSVIDDIDEDIPDAVLHDYQRCVDIGMDVLGEMPDGKAVKVYSFHHKKTVTIPDVSRLSYESLLQILGERVREKVVRESNDKEGGARLTGDTLADVRESISTLAGYRKIGGGEDGEKGVGVWAVKGSDNRDLVLVNNSGGSRLRDGQLMRITKPRTGGMVLNFGEGRNWYDEDKLQEYIARASNDPSWVVASIKDAVDTFRRWSWKRPETDPEVAVGLIMATWIQTLWKWRPQVAITGESNTGKSLFFQMLTGGDEGAGLFSGLSMLTSSPSAAGIRQLVRASAGVLLIDEFEHSRQRDDVLQLFRTTGRKTSVHRGKPSHTAEKFGLQHIPWVAAIEINLKDEADRNRFIMLELVRPAASEHGKLRIPHEKDLEILGQKLLAIALVNAHDAVALAEDLKATHIAGVMGRFVEVYSVPVAMMAAAQGWGIERARDMLVNTLKDTDCVTMETDQKKLVDDILSAWVDCSHGERYAVSKIITDPTLYEKDSGRIKDSLGRHGIAIVEARNEDAVNGGRRMFVVPKIASTRLLQGSTWYDQDIGVYLARIPGARRDRQRVSGHRQYGVSIPFEWVVGEYLEAEPETKSWTPF